MKRDQKQKPEGKRGFPGLLLLFIIGLVVILAFQNLSETKMANVSFSHQIEHLVNLDLLDEGHSRKTALNDNLVSFNGLFRENLTEAAKDRYRYINLLNQHHELNALKGEVSADLDTAYRDAYNSMVYYLQISGAKLPLGGYIVVPRNFDTPDSSNALVIKEIPSKAGSLVTLPQVKKELDALSSERSQERLLNVGQTLTSLLGEYRSEQLGIGDERLKKELGDANKKLSAASQSTSMGYSERLQEYNQVFATIESVSAQLNNPIEGVRGSGIRHVRVYLEQVEKLSVVNTDARKNALQLSKARGKVSSFIWFYNNTEISTKELEQKNPSEYQRWFSHANKEWVAFEANKGYAFRAPDQPRTLALEKTFKTEEPAPNYFSYLFTFMPILLVGLLLYFIFTRQMKGGGSSAMNFGKSPAKMLNKSNQRVTFNDVAGIQEAKEELEEVVEFLKDSRRFVSLGARIPKGVLLVGGPGTGKTLIAKAVAGEAGVPFFSISGSDFVEMFVGVGASRVRDLFEQARKNAPCIIFIDEIDAVGRHRGSGLGGGHDEREQTLNQLLVEMDGFDASLGIIMIAATNRPDVLDKALLRPGRFDRQVHVDNPDLFGRLEILKVHARKIKMSDEVNLKEIAAQTSGLAGADLENILNEAALYAARKRRKAVIQEDLTYALDKCRFGKERKSLAMNEEDKIVTAWHEAGHAVIALHLGLTDEVTRVTTIPRGRSLGATHFQEKANRVSYRRSELVGKLACLMGGRVAEEIHLQDYTNGASGDIQMATAYAKAMVTEWGMSDKVGMIRYSEDNQSNLISGFHEREHSEETALMIDQEVKRLIDEAYEKAHEILKEQFDKMERMANMLIKFETLDREDLDEIMEGKFDEEKKQAKIDEFTATKRRPPPDLPPSIKKKQKKLRENPAT